MSIDILSIPSAAINTKWKEPYGSASFNKKLTGIVAPGIYRGLMLGVDPALGDRTVLISTDPDKLDHVAVYQNADGYSITYRDDTSGDIVLSLTSYSSVTVVIALFIDYQIGSNTVGAFRTYTESEFSLLGSSIKDALVVLGTVAVPASGSISSGSITFLRKTLASSNIARGTIPNSPIIKNQSFEVGQTNSSYPKSSLFWDKSVSSGSGTWKTSASDFYSGSKSIEFSVSSGPISAELSQQVGVATSYREMFIVSIAIKQLKTVSSGSIFFFMEWADASDAVLSTSTQTIDGGAVDSSFRTISLTMFAPSGAASLRSVGIRASSLFPSSNGIFAYIDSVSVSVEPYDLKDPYPFYDQFRANTVTPSVLLTDKTGDFSSASALVRFDSSSPASEGTVYVERIDQDNSGANLPPALSFLGRLIGLGSGLLLTAAKARKPRISALYSASFPYTLLWESAPDSGTSPALRIYAGSSGKYALTVNAYFDGSNFNKDTSGTGASMVEINSESFFVYTKPADENAAWASWPSNLNINGARTATLASPHFKPLVNLTDSSSNRRVAFDHLGFPNSRISRHEVDWVLNKPTTGGLGGSHTISSTAFMNGPGIVMSVSNPTNTSFFGTDYLFGTPQHQDAMVALEFEADTTSIAGAIDVFFEIGYRHSLSHTSTDGYVKFSKSGSSPNWQFLTRSTSTVFSQDTGVAATGIQRFRIEWYGSNNPGGARALAFINGALVAECNDSSKLPDGDEMPLNAWLTSISVATLKSVTVSPLIHSRRRILSDDLV